MGTFALIIFFLLVNAFFVAVEFALVGSRRSRLEPLAAEGNRSAQRALRDIGDLNIQLAGAQLGITVASLFLGLIGEPAVAHFLLDLVGDADWVDRSWARPVAAVIGLFIIIFAHMVLSEMVPKNFTLTRPEGVLRVLSLPNRAYIAVFRPFLWLLTKLGNGGVRLLGIEPRDELASAATVEELEVLVTVSREGGAISDSAAALFSGVFDFASRPVANVCVDRAQIVAVPLTTTLQEVQQIIRDTGKSRIVIVGDDGLEDIVGFVHAKDLVNMSLEELAIPIPPRMVRPVLRFVADTPMQQVASAMQARRIHISVITNDDDSTRGIVTLDDLLDELVGDIVAASPQ